MVAGQEPMKNSEFCLISAGNKYKPFLSQHSAETGGNYFVVWAGLGQQSVHSSWSPFQGPCFLPSDVIPSLGQHELSEL